MRIRRSLKFISCLLLAGTTMATLASAAEQSKWFVLRDHQTGYCWPALLVRIDDGYPHGFANRAGGPYDTEAQALERRQVLMSQGTCRQE